jgi:small subunit ribosomal protein S3
MAQKINPNSYRLGLNVNWSSRWFFKKNLRYFLEEDEAIRKIIRAKILAAGIAAIELERTGNNIRVNVRAGRPGLIIGRGGKGIEDLKNDIVKKINSLRLKNNFPPNFNLNLNIEELKRFEVSAPITAQQIAFDIEKRLPYRRLMKRTLEGVMQNHEVKGAKIRMSGRLDGKEIARVDWLAKGKMPLQTLRSHIDYGEATAFNTYGTVGIKVWLYKGEIFEEKEANKTDK